MTDVPDSTADGAANDSAPDGETPAGDPELAALVLGVRAQAGEETTQATETAADALVSDQPGDAVPADSSPISEPEGDAVPVLPVAAIVADDASSTRPTRRRSFALRFGVAFVLGFALVIGVGTGVLYAWGQQYEGRILPGVRVGSLELGGLTREQAETEIASAYGALGAGQITLAGPDGQVTTISYADVDRGPDTSALVDAALAAGRHDEPIADLIGAPKTAIHGFSLDAAVVYDHDKLAAAVETLAKTIDQTPEDATVSTGQAGTVFSVSSAQDGRAVDQAALLSALDQQLAVPDASATITMAIPVVTVAPDIATSAAEEARVEAERMAADLVVARGEDSWTIAGTSLAPLISFRRMADGSISPFFDESGLDAMVTALAKKVDQTKQEAGLKLVGRHVVATGASREGRTLNVAGMKDAIATEIRTRQAGAVAAPVAAVVKAVAPKLTTTNAEAFAPKMRMISSFSVFYWVIVNNHWGGNIEAPATKINGTVVPAGGTFDFWKVVGDLHDLPGTGPGNAIEGGKITVTGAFGGGICTTSTTLFNAAFHAGMIPLARQNHNEFIDRYPAGLDATVWIVGKAKQTMSFKNDTEYPILITRTIRNEGNKRWLTFKIWSVPNGRTATVTNTVIQAGERAIDTVVHDPTKPVGYAKRNNSAVNGAKVWTTVTIYDHGKLHWQKRYFSNYPAVDGVVIVGTKTS